MPLSEAQIRYRTKNRDTILKRKREYRNRPEVKDKIRESHRNWRLKNYKQQWMYRIQQRCLKRNIEFNLTIEDFDIPDICPALGCKIIVSDPKKFQTPSMDRIDPKRGYVKGNVRVISYRANQIKSNSSLEEMEAVLNYRKSTEL